MAQSIERGLASYVKNNPNTILKKRQDWTHTKISLKLLLSDDGGIPGLETTKPPILSPKDRRNGANSSLNSGLQLPIQILAIC